MNKVLATAYRLEIVSHIRNLSKHYGCDDINWLDEYIQDVLSQNEKNLLEAVNCFRDLVKQLEWMPKHDISHSTVYEKVHGVVSYPIWRT